MYNFNHFLEQYGYLALFIGCLLEGETLLLLAGFAAHLGSLSFPLVVLLAFLGGTLGDQLFFLIGRHFGPGLLQRWPRAQQRSARVLRLLERYHRWIIVGIRFMYGLRVIGPVIIGSSRVQARTFILFNMLGALIWALLMASLGYFFGLAAQQLFGDLKQNEAAAMLILAAAGVLWLFLRHLWQRRS
jgi:membrane protein DedA with SNARE-associated domain